MKWVDIRDKTIRVYPFPDGELGVQLGGKHVLLTRREKLLLLNAINESEAAKPALCPTCGADITAYDEMMGAGAHKKDCK